MQAKMILKRGKEIRTNFFFFSYFFPIFKIILACIFANNKFLQRYAKVRPGTGHYSAIFFHFFLLYEQREPLGFRAMSYRAPKIAVLPSKLMVFNAFDRSI